MEANNSNNDRAAPYFSKLGMFMTYMMCYNLTCSVNDQRPVQLYL